MSVTEEKRHHLYQRLEEVLGAEEATTMMELVPPVGWADVATRHDIQELARSTKRGFEHSAVTTAQEFALVRSEMREIGSSIRSDFHREMRVLLLAILGFNMTLFAAAVALVRF